MESPRQLLLDRARGAEGGQPFLFEHERDRPGWRWQSYARLAEAVEARDVTDPGIDPRIDPDMDPSSPALVRWLRTDPAWSPRALAVAGEWLRSTSAPAGGERDVLVWSRPVPRAGAGGEVKGTREDTQAVLAWALASGAALVLEPDPAAVLGTIAWVRPTVLAGSAPEVEQWIRDLLRWRGSLERLGRRRGELGRCRAVLLLAGDRAAASLLRERFAGRRVNVVEAVEGLGE